MSLKSNKKNPWTEGELEELRKELEESAEEYRKANLVATGAVWEAWEKATRTGPMKKKGRNKCPGKKRG